MSAKTPRLPHSDFANYAMMPIAAREKALLAHSTYVPHFTLKPFRKSLVEICNVQSGMFRYEPSSLDVVREHVKKHCRSYPDSETICLEVAEALWQHVQQNKIFCEERLIEPVSLAGIWSVQYWHDFYMVQDGALISPLFDGRKGNTRLTNEGCLFACSVSKYFLARGRFRALQPVVYQFPGGKRGRLVSPVKFSESELIKIEELEQRVSETTDLWRWVLQKRAA